MPYGSQVVTQSRVAARQAAPLLELQNLSTHYVSAGGARVVRAVDDVTLRVNAGETIFLKGSAGTGMMAVLSGEVRISAPSRQGKEIARYWRNSNAQSVWSPQLR